MTPVNQDVVSLAGQVVIQHACGVYRNYAFFLADQSGQRISTYFVLDEAFSNYSSPTNLPPPPTLTTSYGPNDKIGDLHLLAFIYPDCLQSNDYQTFTQKVTITINSTKYYPSTTINITRGNVAGTLKVDRTITTP